MRKYIFRMAIISLAPSILMTVMLGAIGLLDESGPIDVAGGDYGPPVFAFLLLVIIGPSVETLLLSFGIWLLSVCVRAKAAIVVMSALLWACLHSLQSPPWGLIVFWPFVVFSCAYITWRQKSWLKAIWVAFCIHAIQNLLPAIAMFASLSMAPSDPAPEGEVRAALVALQAAWENRDVDKMVAAYSDSYSTPQISGKSVLRAYFGGLVAQGGLQSLTVGLEECEIAVDGYSATAGPVHYDSPTGRISSGRIE